MIIGLSGKSGSGKDTVAKIIQYLTHPDVKKNNLTYEEFIKAEYCEDGQEFKNKKFADKLKNLVCGEIIHSNLWINTLMSEYKNMSFKFKDTSHIERMNNLPYTKLNLEKSGIEDYETVYHSKWIISDVRFLNQAHAIKDKNGFLVRINGFPKMKIEWASNKAHEDLVKKYTEDSLWEKNENDDLNYKEEIQDEFNSLYDSYMECEIGFERTDEPKSETDLDNYQMWDLVIENESSIDDLIEKVKSFLISKNINMSCKIQINNLEALERLIGNDNEIEMDIRQNIVEAFTKKHLKNIAYELAIKNIDKVVKNNLIEEGILSKHYPNNISSKILVQITQRIEKSIEYKIGEVIAEKIKEYVDSKVESEMQEFIYQEVDRKLNEAVNKKINNLLTKLSNE
jgi:hypothetical protein